MKKFSIEIEIIKRVIRVEAETKGNAFMISKEMYRNEELILDSKDLKSITIK